MTDATWGCQSDDGSIFEQKARVLWLDGIEETTGMRNANIIWNKMGLLGMHLCVWTRP